MKRIVLMICAVIMSCGQVWAQLNEKDTTATMVTSTNASLKLRADILPDYIQLQWTKGPDDLTAYFELYRSADGVAYQIIKQFHPETFDNTANHFIYKDESPLRGKKPLQAGCIRQVHPTKKDRGTDGII